ncbi:MAG: hypothetical protein OXN94_05405 [Chloroflexota bacterium]|nr:hypothetical protein [Chloroflexota bacterium]
MGKPEIMFLRSPVGFDEALRQGEILTNVVEVQIELESISGVNADNVYRANPIKHPFAIIVSQDCDLEQDFNYRFGDKGNQRNLLPSILFCQAESVKDFEKSRGYRSLFNSRTFKNNFSNNDAFRYHFIQEISAELDARNSGLPELGIDFKRYFSMPTAEIYHRIELTHTYRRSVLRSPYRDHLSQRFYNFSSRVALPEEYESN